MSRIDYDSLARVYEKATFYGRPPLKDVADFFDISHDLAAKAVELARKGGYLPPTTPGKKASFTLADPHRPVRCLIDEGGLDRRWLRLCNTCVVEWPCIPALSSFETRQAVSR